MMSLGAARELSFSNSDIARMIGRMMVARMELDVKCVFCDGGEEF